VVTRPSSSPGRRPVVLTAQASYARGRSVMPGALVDEEMLEPQVATTTEDQTMDHPDRVNMAEQFSDPTHAVTADGADGRAAGSSLGGIVPPRATGGRDLSAEGGTQPVTTDHFVADERVTFGSPVSRSSD
jgi:hypothetical protein